MSLERSSKHLASRADKMAKPEGVTVHKMFLGLVYYVGSEIVDKADSYKLILTWSGQVTVCSLGLNKENVHLT